MDDLKETTKFIFRAALFVAAFALIYIHWQLAFWGMIVAIIVGAYLFPIDSNKKKQKETEKHAWSEDFFEKRRKEQEKKQWEKDTYELIKKDFPHGVDAFEKLHPGCTYWEVLNKRNEIYNIEQEYKDKEKERLQEYEDIKINFPHGFAEFKKLHPNHSWYDIWEHRTDVWRLEHDYKLKKHDGLRESFPHGYESFMKENPRATIQEVIKNEDYIKKLEEEYVKDEPADKSMTKVLKSLESLTLALEWSKKSEEIANNFKRENFLQYESLKGNFLYTWIFYYYPTTVDFVTPYSVEDENRKTVWNFKNDPDRHISHYRHQQAVREVLPKLQMNLIRTYGKEELKKMALVCVPASTQVKNKARYETFSKLFCEQTGMENGYEHMHFVKDGLSKNDPHNSTGSSVRPEVTFDDWFEGRLVVLFDDVVTKGETMLYYRNILQRGGAVVVGGVCIGKTKHERQKRDLKLVLKLLMEEAAKRELLMEEAAAEA